MAAKFSAISHFKKNLGNIGWLRKTCHFPPPRACLQVTKLAHVMSLITFLWRPTSLTCFHLPTKKMESPTMRKKQKKCRGAPVSGFRTHFEARIGHHDLGVPWKTTSVRSHNPRQLLVGVPLPTYPHGKSLYKPFFCGYLWVIIPKNPIREHQLNFNVIAHTLGGTPVLVPWFLPSKLVENYQNELDSLDLHTYPSPRMTGVSHHGAAWSKI